MNCPSCNVKIGKHFIYCSQCGCKIGTADASRETPPPSETDTKNLENQKDDSHASKNERRVSTESLIQVVDNKCNKVIAKGQACFQKINGPSSDDSIRLNKVSRLANDKKLVSIDNKYFFKLDDCNYRVEVIEPFVDSAFIDQNYTTGKWNKYGETNRNDINVYIEHNVQELDKEVQNIVHTLNRFSPHVQTIGSCSGHGELCAWVTLGFSSSRALTDFFNIFEPYKSKMNLTTDERFSVKRNSFYEEPFYPTDVAVKLQTKEVGQSAYEVLDDFDKYLKKIIKLRNRSNNTLDELIERKKEQIEGE